MDTVAVTPSVSEGAATVCGGVALPAVVPEAVVGAPKVTCGTEGAGGERPGATGQLGGTEQSAPAPVLPVGVDEVLFDYGSAARSGGAGLTLFVYEGAQRLVDEALPGAREVDLAGGVVARVTATENGLGATRVEWVSGAHSFSLLGSRVVLPSGEIAGPTLEELLATAGSTL